MIVYECHSPVDVLGAALATVWTLPASWGRDLHYEGFHEPFLTAIVYKAKTAAGWHLFERTGDKDAVTIVDRQFGAKIGKRVFEVWTIEGAGLAGRLYMASTYMGYATHLRERLYACGAMLPSEALLVG